MTDATAETFPDLDALAAKGDGALRKSGGVWSYVGCATCGQNIRLPIESVSDVRVQAALAACAWVARIIDPFGQPIAIVKAPADGSAIRPLQASDVGSHAAATA